MKKNVFGYRENDSNYSDKYLARTDIRKNKNYYL